MALAKMSESQTKASIQEFKCLNVVMSHMSHVSHVSQVKLLVLILGTR